MRIDVVAIIPARYDSTRLPGKPLADIGGKPMICHVFERTSKSRFIGRIVIGTDDSRILETAQNFGAEVVLTSRTHKTGTDRIAEVADKIPEAGVIVNVQGDEPLIAPEMIDQALTPFVNGEKIDISTLCKKITEKEDLENPNVVKVVKDINGRALYFSRATIPFSSKSCIHSGTSDIYFKHIGFYAYARDALLRFSRLPRSKLEVSENLEQLRALENGFNIKVIETDFDSFSVDTQDDLERVRGLISQEK